MVSGNERVSDEARIPEDLACAECGYNLRTASTSGRCPECNWPVAETLQAPRGVGAVMLAAVLVGVVITLPLARLAADFMPIREGSGSAAIVFGVAALAGVILLLFGGLARRRYGRYCFGRMGVAAMLASALFAVACLGFATFWLYLARDTTVYAPAFNLETYLAIQPGTSRVDIERRIGLPLATWTDPETAETMVQYSRRAGFLGWKHLVIYDADNRVKNIRYERTAD